ncbi:flagellar brake protein [Acidaminobacter hydrogenoformans]|uniref:C-di-GMP-binding flagellar brake protein YcgR, contains PilZNR and PilZ domains n=1 Tax=Acidaminobacter hydrogenoformans DSM 2784 TaxID=1120920 RepID=A0A1G5RUF1_9FIRM|nr:PilZ domain-containing protein [Acidaminobacter hydrogenoformans]SCZ77762.1 c-di-GMP-binding flagellar brake protein YcgR, contains PilZNR and PilZ domains [Acidaminobacter hydrogenoformans DSM 2784]
MKGKRKLRLKLNQKVEFILPDHSVASSMVQDLCGLDAEGFDVESLSVEPVRFRVSVPVQNGKERLLEVAVPQEVLIYGGERIYALRVAVGRCFSDEVPLYSLEVLGLLGELQRRQNVRIVVSLPVRFQEVLKQSRLSSKDFVKGLPMVEGYLSDLSAGGLKLVTSSKLTKGQSILLSFRLGDETLNVAGTVKHHAASEPPGGQAYCYGIQFEALPVRLEDKIARFVFERLRQNRKLEL